MSSEEFSSGFVGATSNELFQKALGKIPDSELHKLAYYIALSNKTAFYAEQLEINDGIYNSSIGLNSLPFY